MAGNKIPRNPPGLVRETEVLNGRQKLALCEMLNIPFNTGRKSESAAHIGNSPPPPAAVEAEEEKKKLTTAPMGDLRTPRMDSKTKWGVFVCVCVVPMFSQKRAFKDWIFEFACGLWAYGI